MLNLKFKTHRWIAEHLNHQGDDCITWPYSIANGYGNLKYEGKITYAHRVICDLLHGPQPGPNYHASHSCGRGQLGCCNPRHISWKTAQENMLDKREHGTMHRGGKKRKISAADVIQIRALAKSTPHQALAKRFGITRRNIGQIVNGKSWRTDTATKWFEPEEDAYLHDAEKRGIRHAEIAKHLNRSVESVTGRLYRLRKSAKSMNV